MPDDPNDRRQSSIDSLTRAADLADFQKTQSDKSRAVSDAIRNKDDFRLRLELDVPPYVHDDDASAAAESAGPPTLQERFSRCAADLRASFKYSEFLPANLTQEWIATLRALDISKPWHALDAFQELVRAYQQVVERARPRRDIFDLAITETMQFEREQEETARELRALNEVLTQAFDAAITRMPPGVGKKKP